METGHSDLTTEGIRVRVAAQFLPEDSDPALGHFAYQYQVVIENVGDRRAQLRSRHWIIRDANGEPVEVRGPGVVGEYPELAPGERFVYTSGCPLRTEWGTMEGTYRMAREDGTEFDVQIGRFFLAPTVAPIEEVLAT